MRCIDNIRSDSLLLLNITGWRRLAEDRDIWRQRGHGLMMRVEMPLKKQMKKNLHVDAYIKAVSYRTSSNENRRTV
jgi:hypothetical protein